MISRLRPFLLVIALGVTGCSDQLVNTRPEAIRGELWGNRALWKAQNLDDYRYTSAVACCIVGVIRQVTVRDGKVVDVRDERGDVLPREEWSRVFTIDEIFEQLAEAQSRNEPTKVSYHRSLGYPVDIVLGTLSNDAGFSLLLSDLTRIH